MKISDPAYQEERLLPFIGMVSSWLVALLILCSIAAYFIWPYQPGESTTAEIFVLLQDDQLGGLMALDLPFLIIQLVNILPLLSLYMVLKEVQPYFALLAVVLGLISVVLLVIARPLVELVLLSEEYAAAATETSRIQLLSAGEVLLISFDGTGWMVNTVFLALSGMVFSVLMLQSRMFSRITTIVGIVSGLPGFGFFLPELGPILLLISTVGGIAWYILIGLSFRSAVKAGRP